MTTPPQTLPAKPTLQTIQTRADVANLLQVSEKYLTFLLYGPTYKRQYALFKIRKRSGEYRLIASPPSPIRMLQEKLKTLFEGVYVPKVSVHGFVSNRSIVTNAAPHIGQRWVLNVDLKSFFPSIHFGRVRGMLVAKPYLAGPGAASVIARICCHGDRLPQGACTSPILANMICARLDGQLLRLARELDCMYTRYADDLSFSTRTREFSGRLATPMGGWTGTKVNLGDDLVRIILDNGFELNESKSRLQFRELHQDVTGVVVNNAPNVRRSFVRQVRAMLHAWEKFGLPAAERAFHDKFDKRSRKPSQVRPSFRLVLKGRIDYLRMVRGHADSIYRRFRNKLHSLDPSLVKEVLPVLPKKGPIEQVWQHWAREYRESVYHIEMTEVNGHVHGATAFAIRRGFFCTAEHVLVGRLSVAAPLAVKVPITSVAVHPRASQGLDMALLKVPIEPLKAPFLPIASSLPEVGEPIAVLGFPSVPGRNASFGIYPGRVESLTTDYWGNVFIQFGGELAGGMSGGPLINAGGSVIGVVAEQTYEKTDGIVRARPFPQVLPISHLSEIDSERLVDPLDYALQKTGTLPVGLRKLMGLIQQMVTP